jgi:hypothetical protein
MSLPSAYNRLANNVNVANNPDISNAPALGGSNAPSSSNWLDPSFGSYVDTAAPTRSMGPTNNQPALPGAVQAAVPNNNNPQATASPDLVSYMRIALVGLFLWWVFDD